MASIKIIAEKCLGCGKCLGACPFGAIHIHNKRAAVGESCRLCSACVSECPFGAIVLEKGGGPKEDIGAYEGLWVFAETFLGELRPVALELLGQAAGLSEDMGCAVTAVMIGDNVEHLAPELISHGADRVIFAQSPKLRDFNDEIYTRIAADMVRREKPAVILMGATAYGRSFAPRLAARLGTGLTADCTRLGYDREKGLLEQTRPAFGGNLMATIICPDHRPQMATVRPHVFKIPAPDPARTGEIISFPVSDFSTGIETISRLLRDEDELSIADADIIVAVGRGIGGEKNIALAKKLADILGAALGASRAVVDSGLMPYAAQIGQTGKTVAPKLYIACGISGAVQHTVGMSGAETVVAVNSDPDAPIFAVSDYCVVSDCGEFLRSFIEELEK